MKALKVLLAALCGAFVLAGCHTMQGFGEDLASSGKAISRAADGGHSKSSNQLKKDDTWTE